MLDEKALRREGWDEEKGSLVTLADGQDWLFVRPVVRLHPRYKDGVKTLAYRSNLGPEFDAMRQAVESSRTEDGDGFALAVLDLGVYLLGLTYDLSLDDRADLVGWSPSGGDDILGTILTIANGGGAPKVSSAGSVSRS